MRFVAAALAIGLLAGCKDKPAKQAAPAKQGSGSAAALPTLTLNAPNVTGPGVEPTKPLSATIFYSQTQLGVDNDMPIEIGTDGLIDPTVMQHVLMTLEERVKSDEPVGIALDGSLTFVRVAAFLGQLKAAGFKSIVLLTRDRGQIPVTLPDPSELGNGVRPYVRLQSNVIDLYSLSGEEGTAAAPKVSMPLSEGTAKLTQALSEIVQRRWPTGTRSIAEATITLQLEQTATATQLMRLIAAVRADKSRALFPSVFLTGPN
jgi:biopolymer transport protein ExbD